MSLAEIHKKAKLVMIPSGFKSSSSTDNLYSVIPSNGDGDFNYAGTTNGTRVNKDGLIEIASSNQPRLDYNPSNPQNPHLLLEPSRRNLLKYYNDYSQSDWSKNNITVTDNDITAPDGSLTGAKILTTATTTGTYLVQSVSETTGTDKYTFSIFIKKGDTDRVALRFQTNYPDRSDVVFVFSTASFETQSTGGSISVTSNKIVAFQDGWFRIELTIQAVSGNSTVQGYIRPRVSSGVVDATDTGTSFCYVWGGQMEESAFATSVIPTANNQVTRTADTCNSSGSSSIFNDSEGVLFMNISALINGEGGDRTISISDGSQSNSIQLLLHNTASRINFRVRDGGSLEVNISDLSTNQTLDLKVACKYKSGDYSLFVNGTEKATTTSGNLPSGLNQLAFDDGAFNDFFGKCKQLMYFDTILTDAELTTLTT
jgi:hypothetical protein